MSRIAPALLVCLLVSTSATRADDAYPPLDQRLGKTITVVEKNFPTEKAVITQVWRLEDGSPCMQAKTLTSNTQMTLVENLAAKTITERIKVHRWINGVCPAGCPKAPAQAQGTVTQTQFSKPAKEVPQVVTTKTDTVVTTEGGLLPVLPKKEVLTAVPEIKQPAVKTDVVASAPRQITPPAVKEMPVVSAPAAPAAPIAVKSPVQAPVAVKTIVQPPVQAAPATPVVTTAKPELVGGCEVITVTENGTARKYKVLGTARDAHGVMTHRCQALDTNEIVTLNCDSCCGKACAPVAKCETPCKPVPCKTDCKPCEPVKVACEPVKVCAPVTKPCDPCTTVKKDCDPCAKKHCAPCATKACDPCKDKHCADKKCGDCGKGDCSDCQHRTLDRSSSTCGNYCGKHSLFEHGCRPNPYAHCGLINVPVPGVRLHSYSGMPAGPPPQAMVPAFCTMNSTSVRCYMNSPNVVPLACLYRPFSESMNYQIAAGIYHVNGVNGDAVASTLHLINVLNQSKEWENRQWAAQRLQQATLPSVRPYVEDALLAAVQTDHAPLVKVAAIRTLASMQSLREDVMSMLAYAAADTDPRIKEAANEAISMYMKNPALQQAGYTK